MFKKITGLQWGMVVGIIGIMAGLVFAVPPVTITNPDGSPKAKTVVSTATANDTATVYSGVEASNGYERLSFFVNYDETEHLGAVKGNHLAAGGSGYAVNDTLTLADAGTNATLKVNTIAYGKVLTLASAPTAAGTGYSPNDVLTITTGGTGATTKVLTTTVGAIATVASAPTAAGDGYHVNDVLTIVQAGASGGTAKVATVGIGGDDHKVATITLLTAGTGYSASAGLATTVAPAGGTNCTVEVATVDGAIGAVTAVQTTPITQGITYTTGAGKATTSVPSSGRSGCTVNIATSDGVAGAVLTYTKLTEGLGYSVGDTQSTSVDPAGGSSCTIHVTSVGAALSEAVTLDISPDGVTYQAASFYDYAGGATLQTSETLNADGNYYFWTNRDINAPYTRVKFVATNSEANDTIVNTVTAASH